MAQYCTGNQLGPAVRRRTGSVGRVREATFSGSAKVRLMGLPVKTEASELELLPGKETLEFAVKVAADAPAGKHDNIFCRIEVPQGEALMIHQTPATSLRIDKPLPPEKVDEGK